MKTIDSNLTDITSITETLLGTPPDKIEPFRAPSGGLESQCFRLWKGKDALFMKTVAQGHQPIGLYFYNRLEDAGLPVPKLIAWHPNIGANNQSCTIWEYVDGQQANWLKTNTCPYDEAHCGELLHQIHDLKFDGPFCFFEDEPPDREFGPCTDNWEKMFPYAQTAQRFFDEALLTRKEADTLTSLPTLLDSELAQVEKRLLHMDFFFNGNLILEHNGTKIVSILDYAEAMSGDPHFELAVLERHGLSTRFQFDIQRFRSGYGTGYDPNAPLINFYILAILLYERLFFDDESRNQVGKRNIDTVKSLLQSFM